MTKFKWIFIFQILFLISFLVFVAKGCEYVMEKGLKNIVNEVWEGSNG
ncbi:MAG: hypothetical protein ACW96U_00695 [Candidatus Heimdallarchaeaceae archaeon]|jgi:hypothetical protein